MLRILNPIRPELKAQLLRYFGLPDFRPGQAEVIQAVLEGRNAVVVMPTGAGKSLCYQLPAVMLPGVTLVVSPLIALMKDQVEQLRARRIFATFINSSLSDAERTERLRGVRGGSYKLVYVAPERFRSPAFLDALSEAQVDLFAIDEAHCISHWGHDFRLDYARLGQARKRLRPPRTVALTATATPEVRDDIIRSLLMKEPQVFVAGFDRRNLFLEVFPVAGDVERRAACGQLVAECGSGIVYCATRRAAETLHRSLKERGHPATLYHAGMDEESRRKAQDEFMAREDAVAVATNAFGMGIDKPNIRFVAHANIPRAVEAYYQEIGRAGRDGAPARAVLLFNHSDVFTQERLIQTNHPTETVFADVWNALQRVEEFEKGIAGLAGQVGASEFEVSAVIRILEREGKLSRSGRGEGRYQLRLAGKAAQIKPHSPQVHVLLEHLRGRFAVGATVNASLPELARGAGLAEVEAHRAIGLLEKSGALILERPFSGRTIRPLERVPYRELDLDLTRLREQEQRSLLLLRRMTDYAYARRCRRAFILRYFGESAVAARCIACDNCVGGQLRSPSPTRPPHRSQLGARSELAVSALRRWRRELARDLNLPAFIIFNDQTLLALASALPVDRDSFLAVKGTGAARWERFGPKVVEICLLARAAEPGPRQRQATDGD